MYLKLNYFRKIFIVLFNLMLIGIASKAEKEEQAFDEEKENKIFKSMQIADEKLKKARNIFPSSFVFDIEPAHQIFAKALNIDDIKMAEALVNLMRDENSQLNKEKFSERLKKLANKKKEDIISIYYECYNGKENFPQNCLEHLIKLWLKRNSVITFDPMAQKSYINNLLKQNEIKSTGKMTQKEFENLFYNDPKLSKLIDDQIPNKPDVQPSNQLNPLSKLISSNK